MPLKWIQSTLLTIFFVPCLIQADAEAEDSIITSMERTLPAVVAVKAEGAGLASTRPAAVRDPNTGRILLLRGIRGSAYKRTASGVIIDPSGIVVSAAHTVSKADRVTVILQDGTEIPGEPVRLVPDYDFAFIRITPPKPLIAFEFSEKSEIQLGMDIFTVGGSELLKNTFTGGVISGIGRNARSREEGNLMVDLIQTSFNVYEGDSGAPVLDREGKLIGLMTATKITENHVSYAIPSYKIKHHYLEYLKDLPPKSPKAETLSKP